MSTISIVTTGDRTTVRSPFHPDWPARARALGGRFRDGAWLFDARDEAAVRALARSIYGTDGTPDPGGMVSVRVEVDNVRAARGRPASLHVAGRLMATRYGRDEQPRLGPGVILVSGGFRGSAGSTNYVELGPEAGTVVEVRDVPRAMAVDTGLDIVDDRGPDRDALRAERERLTARLAEIDAILGTPG